jgi:hypothetical protein
MRVLTLLLTALLVGCGPYPRDMDETLDEIEDSGELHIGLAPIHNGDEPAARDLVARLERATGARAKIDRGSTELQLARLQQGGVDLVIGDFDPKSPWMTEVTIVDPITPRWAGDRVLGLSPVVANGENRWVGVVEGVVRDMQQASRR